MLGANLGLLLYGEVSVMIKSDFEESILKLATYGQREKGLSVVIKILSPKGLSAPALVIYTCIKALKYIPGPGVR